MLLHAVGGVDPRPPFEPAIAPEITGPSASHPSPTVGSFRGQREQGRRVVDATGTGTHDWWKDETNGVIGFRRSSATCRRGVAATHLIVHSRESRPPGTALRVCDTGLGRPESHVPFWSDLITEVKTLAESLRRRGVWFGGPSILFFEDLCLRPL